jgi:hypothetical protein
MVRLICVLFLIGFPLLLSAQDHTPRRPDSRSPGEQSGTYGSGIRKSQKSARKSPAYSYSFDRLVAEQQQRMAANSRERKKMAREMEKPQYSDPSYFGHKKQPVKNPPGKKKFCKECGLRH